MRRSVLVSGIAVAAIVTSVAVGPTFFSGPPAAEAAINDNVCALLSPDQAQMISGAPTGTVFSPIPGQPSRVCMYGDVVDGTSFTTSVSVTYDMFGAERDFEAQKAAFRAEAERQATRFNAVSVAGHEGFMACDQTASAIGMLKGDSYVLIAVYDMHQLDQALACSTQTIRLARMVLDKVPE